MCAWSHPTLLAQEVAVRRRDCVCRVGASVSGPVASPGACCRTVDGRQASRGRSQRFVVHGYSDTSISGSVEKTRLESVRSVTTVSRAPSAT